MFSPWLYQGKRILTTLYSKDLREVVGIPAGHSASHGDALFVLLLLEKADSEPFEPREIVRGEAISHSTVVFPKCDIQAPM